MQPADTELGPGDIVDACAKLLPLAEGIVASGREDCEWVEIVCTWLRDMDAMARASMN